MVAGNSTHLNLEPLRRAVICSSSPEVWDLRLGPAPPCPPLLSSPGSAISMGLLTEVTGRDAFPSEGGCCFAVGGGGPFKAVAGSGASDFSSPVFLLIFFLFWAYTDFVFSVCTPLQY